MEKLQITDYTLTTALGTGNADNWMQLAAGKTGLAPCEFFDVRDLPCYVGEIPALNDLRIVGDLQKYDCRNNRLAMLALQQDKFSEAVAHAIERYGADRVATFIGTSTSGIHQTELAYISRDDPAQPLPDWYHYLSTHNVYSITDYVQRQLGVCGISSAISTACSSSAKVFASAERAMRGGWCDAAIVGGVDTLCLTTLYGFHSLQLVDADICRPCDNNRAGLSIGEAAGFALVERSTDEEKPELLGYGESGDAYHMSSPHPQGIGARMAMQDALLRADLGVNDVDYINLHGTGTKANDLAESNAVQGLFGNAVPCSSTKGWTGHTLGAAGIVEAIFSLLCIENNYCPPCLNLQNQDDNININILAEPLKKELNVVLSNSFGFGGSNCSLVLGMRS